MRALLGASVKMVVRDRQALFWALAFPIIFLGVFRLFSFDAASPTSLVIGGDTRMEAGAALVRALESVPFLEVEVRPDLDEGRALAALGAGTSFLDAIKGG